MANAFVLLLSVQAVLGHATGLFSHAMTPASGAAEALLALDTDKSGKVERAEVEAFAQSQGLTAEQVRIEFKDLDLNGDGELSAEEISNTLQDSAAAPPATQAAPSATVAMSAPPPTLAAASASLVPPALIVTPTVNAVQARESIPAATQLAVATRAVPQPELANAVSQQPAAVALADVDSAASQVDSQMAEVTLDAQQHAGKALAEVFARSAAKALEARSQDDQQATKLEEQAKSLRGQSAEIKRTAAALTIKAATDAATAVMKEAAAQERVLEEQAAQAEKDAQERRKQAKDAMDKAVRAQADMSSSLQDLQHQ